MPSTKELIEAAEREAKRSVSRSSDDSPGMVKYGVWFWLKQRPTGERIYIADLKSAVSFAPSAVDTALKDLQREGKLVLYAIDTPMGIKKRDHDAALFIAGKPRHIIYRER